MPAQVVTHPADGSAAASDPECSCPPDSLKACSCPPSGYSVRGDSLSGLAQGDRAMAARIIRDRCRSCGHCVAKCRYGNRKLREGKVVVGKHCVDCRECYFECPHRATAMLWQEF